MTREALFLSTVLALGATGDALAQEAPPALPIGMRVRVVSSSGVIRGILLRHDGSALQIAPERGGMAQTVPLASVASLELATGRKGNAKKGAIIGALFYGAFFAISAGSPESCDPTGNDPYLCDTGRATALGALLGAPVGALIGHFVKTDHYTPIDIGAYRPRPPAAAGPGRAPLGFQVALRF